MDVGVDKGFAQENSDKQAPPSFKFQSGVDSYWRTRATVVGSERRLS